MRLTEGEKSAILELAAQEAHDARVPFLVELKKRVGDRRIDLVVATPESEKTRRR